MLKDRGQCAVKFIFLRLTPIFDLLLLVVLSQILFFISIGNAQQVEMSSTLNPVGSGARAMGMGGAFISIADDATAASWNPAGLIHLERPEVSIVYSYFRRGQSYSSYIHPEIGSENSMDANGLNYASAAYPFILFNRNMIISLNYQRLYEMDKKVNFKYTWDLGGGKLYDNIEFKQNGFLYAVSPAMAVQIIPELYLGTAVNFWGNYLGKNGWDNTYNSYATGTVLNNAMVESVDWRNKISFKGINAHFGVLWNFYGPFTLGGVYKTPFDAGLKKQTTFSVIQDFPNVPLHNESTTQTTEYLTMKMPASYGLGLSYRHSDSWTVAFDVYRTDWSDFYIKNAKGNRINPIDGKSLNEGKLKDTTQLRLGTEYLFIMEKGAIPLRCGLFYDPEPGKGSLDDYYGFSFGTGYSSGKISVDASYQYRTGKRVSGDISTIQGSSADVNQHTVMMSVIYYF